MQLLTPAVRYAVTAAGLLWISLRGGVRSLERRLHVAKSAREAGEGGQNGETWEARGRNATRQDFVTALRNCSGSANRKSHHGNGTTSIPIFGVG